ncbi:MAG: NAD-dependent epimerase/dehydratase family protein [Dehalococcoidia bacterium]
MADTAEKHFVTGGAGFIGSHLVEYLLSKGKAVTVYDSFVSGKGGWTEFPQAQGMTSVRADLLDKDALIESVRGHDFVWHLGSNTNIPDGVKDPSLDLKNCVIATCNVLEAMRINGVKKMGFSSSGSVYGDFGKTGAPENVGPLLPLSLYAAGKLSCESFIAAYCHLFDLQAWIFRYGNVIGGRMGHGVIFDFIRKLRANPKELVILGDGQQEKNYFLVDECIDGMEYLISHTDAPCDIFNLGADTTSNVKSIARIIIEEMGLKDVKLSYTGGEGGWPGDQPKVYLDTSRLRNLGWRPKRASDEAVRVAVRRVLGKEG